MAAETSLKTAISVREKVEESRGGIKGREVKRRMGYKERKTEGSKRGEENELREERVKKWEETRKDVGREYDDREQES